MANKQTAFRLSQSTLSYIDEIASATGLSKTDSLEKIISEHKTYSDTEVSKIADAVLAKFDDRYKNLFTRLRLSTNYSDKNIQIILELLNTLVIALDIQNSFTTRVLKSPVFESCEKEVNRKITEYKQAIDDKKEKSQENK